jgi:hypothetical protein
MFGNKRLKQLEELLEQEQERNNRLIEILEKQNQILDKQNGEVCDIVRTLRDLTNKVAPQPIPTYNVDVANFTNKLKGFTKKKMCLPQGCQYYYIVPSWIIDKVKDGGNEIDLGK